MCACVRVYVCAFVFALLFRQLVASLLRFLLHTHTHTAHSDLSGFCCCFCHLGTLLWSLNEFFSLPRLVVFNCFMRSLAACRSAHVVPCVVACVLLLLLLFSFRLVSVPFCHIFRSFILSYQFPADVDDVNDIVAVYR